MTPVAGPRPHPGGVVRGQPEPTNALPRYKPPVYEKLGDSGAEIVGRANVRPAARPHSPTRECGSGAQAPTLVEPHKQLIGRNHPEMHAPAVGFVVKDRASAALVVDPRQKGDGLPRVESSRVRELDITPWSPKKSSRTTWFPVRPRCITDSAKSAGGVAK